MVDLLITLQCTEFNKLFCLLQGFEKVRLGLPELIQCSKNWTKLQDFFGSVDKYWKSFEGSVDIVFILLIS